MFWIPGVLPAYCLVITHVFLYVALTKRDHKAYASFKLLPWEQSSLEENILIFFFYYSVFPFAKEITSSSTFVISSGRIVLQLLRKFLLFTAVFLNLK